MWESLFSLACLIKNEPAQEPVAEQILAALQSTDTGAFSGNITDQINIARAAISLFEYTADRAILQRLANWVRYLETTWEQHAEQTTVLYQPADLMELLVKYYRVSGIRPVLRLCARLRAEAFDWTSALNTFQQHIPLISENNPETKMLPSSPRDLDYEQRQRIINHAEMLADGVRYSLYSGIYSGNRQDLSAGKTAWMYLKKHHRAVCGGTTAGPFLSGNGPDKPISNKALSAWTEALASQLLLSDSSWAADELVRIVFNGLADCIGKKMPAENQYVNTIRPENTSPISLQLLARICRATAAAFRHAVSISENGFSIHYLLPGKYMLMCDKKPIVIHAENDTITFQCKEPVCADIRFFYSGIETSELYLKRSGKEAFLSLHNEKQSEGFYIRLHEEWVNRDGFILRNSSRILQENAHHHGVCYYAGNRLLCMDATEQYAYAVCEDAKTEDSQPCGIVSLTHGWSQHDGIPDDLPVFPSVNKDDIRISLKQYDQTCKRIAMFPRAGKRCLK